MTIEYRPWGFYRIIDQDRNYLVKLLEVFPGERTSLQFHKYRNEFWYVVDGTANVVIDKESMVLSTRDTLFIPSTKLHRISNDGNSPLKIIEIQTGIGPFAEDDIIRVEDDYERSL